MTNSKYLIGGGVLEDICDAVREIEGSSSKILVSDLPGRVAGLEQKIEDRLPPISRKMLEPVTNLPSAIDGAFYFSCPSQGVPLNDKPDFYIGQAFSGYDVKFTYGSSIDSYDTREAYQPASYRLNPGIHFVAYGSRVDWVRLANPLVTFLGMVTYDMPHMYAIVSCGEIPVIIFNGDSAYFYEEDHQYFRSKVIIIVNRSTTATLTSVIPDSPKIGKIFVPDSQLSAYKTATNWNTIADHIYPISSYTNFID